MEVVMAFLNWKDQYSVKVGEIDEQHKNLFNLINGFMDAVKNGIAQEKLKHTVHGLESYAEVHFKTEEDYMLKFGYGGYAEHKSAHELFFSKVKEFKGRLEDSSIKPEEVGRFLMDWLVKHIMGVDRKYSEFFNSKGLK